MYNAVQMLTSECYYPHSDMSNMLMFGKCNVFHAHQLLVIASIVKYAN